MDVTTFLDFASTQGIWCALFIWLFHTTRLDGKEREKRLMACVDKLTYNLDLQTEHMKDMANTLDRVMDLVSK